jgi:hypothetical protein
MLNPAEMQVAEPGELSILNWGPDAPRGGKAVLNRALKENTTVPLFFAQTMISSLRDVGYNHTTSALCEHVDNAIEAGATEVRIFFRQSGKKGDYQTDVAVYDNGKGMSPNVLKVATSFGGSTSFNNRSDIGRFGMGMKTAALSMSPIMELYSWQEKGAYYSMTLDVESIGKDRANLVSLPEPSLQPELPAEVSDMFIKPMGWPSDRGDQVLLASDALDLSDRLGSSGTIVYMPACDRLTYAKARTLVEHAVSEMARVYRRFIEKGVRLFVNNRQVDAFDPTYSMVSARHTRYLEGLGVSKHSRLYLSRSVDIKLNGKDDSPTAPITVKIYRLPIEEWSSLGRKTLRNDLRVFDDLIVTILRNNREVAAKAMPELTTRHNIAYWYRIQIDFPGTLDEAFGVSSNKQGVRMKDYVLEAINKVIGQDISALNDELKRFQAQKASEREAAKPAASELRANEVDHQQAKPIDADLTPQEMDQLDANLRGLALSVKREGETDDQTFERVKSSKYLIVFRHDEYWPFYHVDHKFGRILLTINTGHPFYSRLYEPIRQLQQTGSPDAEEDRGQTIQIEKHDSPIVALELLLLSLARAQSALSMHNEDARRAFDSLRREWSDTYRIQLGT